MKMQGLPGRLVKPDSFGAIAPADLFKPGIDFAPFVRHSNG